MCGVYLSRICSRLLVAQWRQLGRQTICRNQIRWRLIWTLIWLSGEESQVISGIWQGESSAGLCMGESSAGCPILTSKSNCCSEEHAGDCCCAGCCASLCVGSRLCTFVSWLDSVIGLAAHCCALRPLAAAPFANSPPSDWAPSLV